MTGRYLTARMKAPWRGNIETHKRYTFDCHKHPRWEKKQPSRYFFMQCARGRYAFPRSYMGLLNDKLRRFKVECAYTRWVEALSMGLTQPSRDWLKLRVGP